MYDVGPLIARIASGVFQQAYVVSDLAAAEQAFSTALGCGPWVDLPPSDLQYQLRGAPVSAALAIGFARSGNMQLELIEPVRGAGLHVEFLEMNGPGAHHLGYLVDDLDGVVALATECGAPPLMGATFGSLRFCYVDTFDALGLFTELVEDPDGMMMSLMPWR